MSNENIQVFRIRCGYDGKSGGNKYGNAFLYADNRLITVRHVVQAFYDGKNKIIELKPNGDGEKIKCEIIGWDGDAFDGATLVVLKPEVDMRVETTKSRPNIEDSTGKVQMKGFLRWTENIPLTATIEYVSGDLGSGTKGIKFPKTNEWVNAQISVKGIDIDSYQGLSGAPIINIHGKICGVFNGQFAIGQKAVCEYAFCNDSFFDALDEAWAMADRSEQPAPPEEPEVPEAPEVLSFAEYVARACEDCPTGIGVVYAKPNEYERQYPGQDHSKDRQVLEDFLKQMELAGVEIDPDSAKAARNKALEKLKQLYCDQKHLQNVYIASLYWVLRLAYVKRASEPWRLEAVKNLLDIACEGFLPDMPQRHLFLAEWYLAMNQGTVAAKELKAAERVCSAEFQNTNCYANLCILTICCPTEDGEKRACQDVINSLHEAIRRRPKGCSSYFNHTEIFRMVAAYQANQAREYTSAVRWITDAFELDSGASAPAEGWQKDDVCFLEIFNSALDWYGAKGLRGYSGWYKFWIHAVRCPMYKRIYGEDLEKKGNDLWIRELRKWNGNRTPLVPGDEIVYEHSETVRMDEQELQRLLEVCIEKGFYLKVSDIKMDDQLFREVCGAYDKFIRSNRFGGGSIELVDEVAFDDQSSGQGAYLYIYQYALPNHDPVPIWHLISNK